MTENKFTNAVADGDMLWPHNSHLIEDARIESAVLNALSSAAITSEEDEGGTKPQPRLLLVDNDFIAMSLLDVMFGGDVRNMRIGCDRCFAQVEPLGRLWVPAGASVVEIHVCAACYSELDNNFSPVVWR